MSQYENLYKEMSPHSITEDQSSLSNKCISDLRGMKRLLLFEF